MVQVREDLKKANPKKAVSQNSVPFKDMENQAIIGMFLKRKKSVREELKRRLVLAGKIEELQKRQKRHLFEGKRQGKPLSWSIFKQKYEKYFRSKSSDRMKIDGHQLPK